MTEQNTNTLTFWLASKVGLLCSALFVGLKNKFTSAHPTPEQRERKKSNEINKLQEDSANLHQAPPWSLLILPVVNGPTQKLLDDWLHLGQDMVQLLWRTKCS